jgi:hypothetical protein
MNKFAKFDNVFEEVRKKLQQKREDQDKRNSGSTFDDSWKFKASLPEKQAKITYEVRVLPHVHSDNGEPWALGLYHMYRKPTGKFVYVLCPSTFDKKAPCPFCEKAAGLFATKDKMDETEARKIYKKKRYFVNVLVVKDERKGEENQQGKVLVWEFGAQIFDKFADALVEQKINFFHPVTGRNFVISIKKKGEYPDYSMSNFSINQSPLAENDEELNKVFDQIYNLNDKVFGKKVYDYAKLKSILENDDVGSNSAEGEEVVVAVDRKPAREASTVAKETVVSDDDVVAEVKKTTPAPTKTAPKAAAKTDDADDFDFDFDEK